MGLWQDVGWEHYVYKYHSEIGFREESGSRQPGPVSFCLLWNSGRKPGEMSSDLLGWPGAGRTLQTIPGHTPLIAPIQPALTFAPLSIENPIWPELGHWEAVIMTAPAAPRLSVMWTLCGDHRRWLEHTTTTTTTGAMWAHWDHHSIIPLSILQDEIEIAGPDPH